MTEVLSLPVCEHKIITQSVRESTTKDTKAREMWLLEPRTRFGSKSDPSDANSSALSCVSWFVLLWVFRFWVHTNPKREF